MGETHIPRPPESASSEGSFHSSNLRMKMKSKWKWKSKALDGEIILRKLYKSITPNHSGDQRRNFWKKAWKEAWSWKLTLRLRAPLLSLTSTNGISLTTSKENRVLFLKCLVKILKISFNIIFKKIKTLKRYFFYMFKKLFTVLKLSTKQSLIFIFIFRPGKISCEFHFNFRSHSFFLPAKMTNFQSKLQVSNGSESSKCLELRYFPFGRRESEKLKETLFGRNTLSVYVILNLWNFYILFFLWWQSKWRKLKY